MGTVSLNPILLGHWPDSMVNAYNYALGYFCEVTRWNAILEVLCQNDGSQNSNPEPIFF
jgi:hypothetical protein